MQSDWVQDEDGRAGALADPGTTRCGRHGRRRGRPAPDWLYSVNEVSQGAFAQARSGLEIRARSPLNPTNLTSRMPVLLKRLAGIGRAVEASPSRAG